MSMYPCCVRVIPYENEDKDNKQLTMCLYVDTNGHGVPKSVQESANRMFTDYHIEFHDLHRRPLSNIVELSARREQMSDQEKEQRSNLSRKIGENLHLFDHRLNVTAVCASYKVKNFKEEDILCVTVYVLGKTRIPAGETDIKDIREQYSSLFDHAEFDVEEGYYRPAAGPELASFASPLKGGVGIGLQNVHGAGTLGGFLQDEQGKCYILSNEHVLHPADAGENDIIVQPSRLDYETLVQEDKKKLNKIRKDIDPPSNLTPEQKSQAQRCRRKLVETLEIDLEDAKRKLDRDMRREPRPIGKYVSGSGLRENVTIQFGESKVEFYVDAAIAKLNEDEESDVKYVGESHGTLYGFEDTTLNGDVISLESFRKELQKKYTELRFMKIGRTTGLTTEGIIDRSVKELYLKIINDKKYVNMKQQDNPYIRACSHIPFIFHENCKQPGGCQLQINVNRYHDLGKCMECYKELRDGDTTGQFWARNCFAVRKRGNYFCDLGDSGALVFGNDGKAWGLLFGNFLHLSRDYCFALISPLSVTLEALERRTGKKLKLL